MGSWCHRSRRRRSAGQGRSGIQTVKYLDSILSFWKRWDTDFESRVSFDACDRERVSRELAEHIRDEITKQAGAVVRQGHRPKPRPPLEAVHS